MAIKHVTAKVVQVNISFDVPALLKNKKGDIEHDLHNDMIDSLMDLPRCDEYSGGHYDNAICTYDNMKQANKLFCDDAKAIQTIVNQYKIKAKQ